VLVDHDARAVPRDRPRRPRLRRLKGRPGTATIYDVKLIGLDGAPVEYRDRVSVRPDLAAAEVASMDVVVVPGLDDDLDASFELNKAWAPWLAKWHAEGATIAASCSGTFLLAEAGLLDGRAATTHWLYADKLATRYPRGQGSPRNGCSSTTATSSPAAVPQPSSILRSMSSSDSAGAERANAAARMLLIDRDRQSQLPYAVSAGHDRFHSKELVHRAQDHIEDRLGTDLRVRDIAAAVGVSERTLVRHFRAELGASVQAQIRRQRIEAAKRFLETSDSPVDSIRRYVGYRDATSYRRAFREETGLTPQGFRGKFAWH
jgi:transcriptional regulator GlxA family with amidase domain